MGLQQRGALFTDESRLLGIVSFYKGWAWGSLGSLPWRVAGWGGKCVQYTGIKAEGREQIRETIEGNDDDMEEREKERKR